MILRVQALFYEYRILNLLIRIFFVLEIVMMSSLFVLGISQLQFGIHCVITAFPGKGAGFFATPIIFEFALFVLTMIKFYEAVRDGWGQENIVTRFVKDGIWAFALPFTFLLINTLCLALIKGALSSVAYSWVIAVPGFAGCHLILNMSHLLQTRRSYIPRTSDHTIMDTFILTSDAITADLDTYELHDQNRNT